MAPRTVIILDEDGYADRPYTNRPSVHGTKRAAYSGTLRRSNEKLNELAKSTRRPGGTGSGTSGPGR